jgi:hypothetical protein
MEFFGQTISEPVKNVFKTVLYVTNVMQVIDEKVKKATRCLLITKTRYPVL